MITIKWINNQVKSFEKMTFFRDDSPPTCISDNDQNNAYFNSRFSDFNMSMWSEYFPSTSST